MARKVESPTVVITGLEAADRPLWTKLWRGYLAFYETTLPDSQYDFTWSRLLNGEAINGLAARSNGEIIGIDHYLFHPSAWTVAPVCYLQDLFVDPASRGSGAGRALIKAVASRAHAAGSSRLYWMTQEGNVTARLLYDRLAKAPGFIRYDLALT